MEEYYKLSEIGLLQDDDRVELIEGNIIDMSPIGSKHAACVKRLISFFSDKLQTRAILSVQDPVQIQDSQPEPDIALLRYRDDFYGEKHPVPDDLLLLIEVADNSLGYDKEVKIPIYAQANIEEVWIINLIDNCIEMYRYPSSEGYEQIIFFFHNQIVSPKNFPDIKFKVEQIVG